MTEFDPAYFLYHSIGQYPGKDADCAAAMTEFAHVWGCPDDGQWEYALTIRQQFIDRWCDIIKAPSGTLTTCENVTSGLSALMGGLPPGVLKGQKVLVAGDCFPSLHFLLSGLAPKLGFTLETVPLRTGENWVRDADVIAQWGPDVGLALLTWVSSTSSHRCDLETMVAHGRNMGSLIGVDITQGAGLLPFDVQAHVVDFALSTSLKWMCGTPGAGILYVAEPLIQKCTPDLRGWFSQPDIFSWDLDSFAFAPDIRRFDNGTPSIIACAASLPALKWHGEQDVGRMLAHNRRLTALLIDGCDTLGLMLASPRDDTERGGSLMVRLDQDVVVDDLMAGLKARNIFADVRGPVLRLSPGVVTTEQHVERLIETLAARLTRQ